MQSTAQDAPAVLKNGLLGPTRRRGHVTVCEA